MGWRRPKSSDAKARYDLAEANNDRAKQLSRTGNVTEKAIDEAAANFEIARAALELQRVQALQAHDRGAVRGARRLAQGLARAASLPSATPIVNLEKIDLLKVDFKLPELFLPSVGDRPDGRRHRRCVARTRSSPARSTPSIRRSTSTAARCRCGRGSPNADLVLRPGLFARILVKGKQTREVVLAPESAIVPRGGETFVFRIENGKAVEAKVKLGERRGAEVEIAGRPDAQHAGRHGRPAEAAQRRRPSR